MVDYSLKNLPCPLFAKEGIMPMHDVSICPVTEMEMLTLNNELW